MIRRLIGLLALAAVVSAAGACHRHALLFTDSERRREEVVTTHDPFSTASHWHAILETHPLDPCRACHSGRLFGLPRPAGVSLGDLASRRWDSLASPSPPSLAQLAQRCRAPPALL